MRSAARIASRNFAGDAVARQTLSGLMGLFGDDEALQCKIKHNDTEQVKNNGNNALINDFPIDLRPTLLFDCDLAYSMCVSPGGLGVATPRFWAGGSWGVAKFYY